MFSTRRSSTRPLRLEALEDRALLAISPTEQFFVYRINYARDNPVRYQTEQGLGVDLSYVTPQPPVAVNAALFASSEAKVNDLIANNYFAHLSPSGLNANKLVRDNGYPLPATLPRSAGGSWVFNDSGNSVESLAAGQTSVNSALDALIVDTGVNPPGHRIHLLGIDEPNSLYRDIGVGYATGGTYGNYWAIHIAAVNLTQSYVTGVVYSDADSDGRLDLNEGLAGVTVQIPSLGLTTTTNAGGGWALAAPNGTYTVQASGGGFNGTSTVDATVAGENVEVDFRSGIAGGQVAFAQVTGPVDPALTLTLPASIAEDGGTAAGTATITRSSSVTAALTVTLTSSDTSEVRVPTTVTIAAGQSSASFFLSAQDDALLDGSQTATITASASGFSPSAKTLAVTDAETLSVLFVTASGIEGGPGITGLLRRNNTDLQAALTVTFNSGNASAAAVPTTVTIPAGAAQTDFVIATPNNASLTGPRTVAISASAPGYLTAATNVTVIDDELIAIWHNAVLPGNVDGLSGVDPQDILYVVYELSARNYSDSTGLITALSANPQLKLDLNADGYIDAQDALFAIDAFLQASGGEGEATPDAASDVSELDLLQLAIDVEVSRRRSN